MFRSSDIEYTPREAASANIDSAVEHARIILEKLGVTPEIYVQLDFNPALMELLKALSGVSIKVANKNNTAIAHKFALDYTGWLSVDLPPEFTEIISNDRWMTETQQYASQVITGIAVHSTNAFASVLPGSMSKAERNSLEAYMLSLMTAHYKQLRRYQCVLDNEVDWRDYL